MDLENAILPLWCECLAAEEEIGIASPWKYYTRFHRFWKTSAASCSKPVSELSHYYCSSQLLSQCVAVITVNTFCYQFLEMHTISTCSDKVFLPDFKQPHSCLLVEKFHQKQMWEGVLINHNIINYCSELKWWPLVMILVWQGHYSVVQAPGQPHSRQQVSTVALAISLISLIRARHDSIVILSCHSPADNNAKWIPFVTSSLWLHSSTYLLRDNVFRDFSSHIAVVGIA
jgi:hypothetical protein